MSNEYSRRTAVKTAGANDARPNGHVGWKVSKNLKINPLKKKSKDSSNVMGQDKKKMNCVCCEPEELFPATNTSILKEVSKNLAIITLKKTSKDTSNRLVQDKKRKDCVCCDHEEPFSPTNIRISKEVTITPIMNTENNVISILKKKLPGITFNLVQQEQVFNVPEMLKKRNIKTPKKITMPDCKSKVGDEKKILLEGRGANKINLNVIDTNTFEKVNSNLKTNQNQEKTHNFNSNTVISGKPERTFNNTLVLEKENIQRTSFYNEVPKNMPKFNSFKKIKHLKPEKKVFDNPILFNEIKQSTNNVSNTNKPKNNKEIRTIESIKEDYTLMDISTKGQINIVSPISSTELYNVTTVYDKFAPGIGEFLEDSTVQFDASQSYVEKRLLTGQMSTFSPDFLGSIKMCLNIDNDIHFDLAPQLLHSIKGNVYNTAENVSKGNLLDCNNPNEEIFPNYVNCSSNLELDEYTNVIKRGQAQNELCKKQKIIGGNLNISISDEIYHFD